MKRVLAYGVSRGSFMTMFHELGMYPSHRSHELKRVERTLPSLPSLSCAVLEGRAPLRIIVPFLRMLCKQLAHLRFAAVARQVREDFLLGPQRLSFKQLFATCLWIHRELGDVKEHDSPLGSCAWLGRFVGVGGPYHQALEELIHVIGAVRGRQGFEPHVSEGRGVQTILVLPQYPAGLHPRQLPEAQCAVGRFRCDVVS
eukprot:scaffold1867_cov247-Pinguiococcus_pyrenoidosus.AAC.12